MTQFDELNQLADELFGLSKDSLLGSGAFANVYHFGENALKLTTDETFNYLLGEDFINDPHLPKIIHAFGIVGFVGLEEPVFAFEIELLSEIKDLPDTDTLTSFSRFNDYVQDAVFDMDAAGYSGFRREAIEMSLDETGVGLLPKSFVNLYRRLSDFCQEFQFDIDYHMGNIMFRPGTNEVVFSDPICPV